MKEKTAVERARFEVTIAFAKGELGTRKPDEVEFEILSSSFGHWKSNVTFSAVFLIELPDGTKWDLCTLCYSNVNPWPRDEEVKVKLLCTGRVPDGFNPYFQFPLLLNVIGEHYPRGCETCKDRVNP